MQRDGFWVVESQAARLPAAGEFGRIGDQQPVLLMRGQTHSGRYCHGERASAALDAAATR